MYNLCNFCNIIAALRKEKPWTQTHLAEQLGISPQSVSKWECGIGYPDVTMFPIIAELFSVPIGVLFGEKGETLYKTDEKKEKTMDTCKLVFSVCQNIRISFGNTCRVEIIEEEADACHIIAKGDPVFLDYFAAEKEDDTLFVNIKNPSGSNIHWEPYDRGGYTDENLVQIFTGAAADKVSILGINYLDLTCTNHISRQGNPEYICEK